MKIFRYTVNDTGRIGLETESGMFDLTDASPVFASISSWLRQNDPAGELHKIDTAKLRPIADVVPLAPIDTQEVWAAGVTYLRSKVARMEESEDGGDFYDKVYEADRPELFFKALPQRVSAPGQMVRIRRDSHWNVPEPEMVLVIASNGKIVGVTVGNDMSSRSIEGENPLYLPQAKTYEGCCALGPAIIIFDDSATLRNLSITLTIERAGQTFLSDTTGTKWMHRTPEELADWLFRELAFPDGVFLMTGTGIIPPDDFTLQIGDIVHITIDGVGTLSNPVA